MEKTPDDEIVEVFSKTENDNEDKANKTVQPTSQREQAKTTVRPATVRPTKTAKSPIKPNPVKDDPKITETPSPSPPPYKQRPARRPGRSPLPTYYRERVFNQKAAKQTTPCKTSATHVHNPIGEARGSQVYRRLPRLKEWEVNLILALDPIYTSPPSTS